MIHPLVGWSWLELPVFPESKFGRNPLSTNGLGQNFPGSRIFDFSSIFSFGVPATLRAHVHTRHSFH